MGKDIRWRLFLLSVCYFWDGLEISAFISVSNEVGGLLTLLGVFLTAIIGITLLKNQGLSVLNRVHRRSGQRPSAGRVNR